MEAELLGGVALAAYQLIGRMSRLCRDALG